VHRHHDVSNCIFGWALFEIGSSWLAPLSAKPFRLTSLFSYCMLISVCKYFQVDLSLFLPHADQCRQILSEWPLLFLLRAD
jgi:hypothetical protein